MDKQGREDKKKKAPATNQNLKLEEMGESRMPKS